jgi:hypothetical protein
VRDVESSVSAFGHHFAVVSSQCHCCENSEDLAHAEPHLRTSFQLPVSLKSLMLANPKDVQSNAIRKLDFVEKVAQAICRAEILTRQGVRYRGHKTIDSDLHNPMLPSFFKRPL